MCRYDYYRGLVAGVSDLIGRDHAVAQALMQTCYTTQSDFFLAFVSKEQSGQLQTIVQVLAIEGGLTPGVHKYVDYG